MSRPRRKRADVYHHGDLRQALVTAALRALERDGLEALSLRALARDLGVSPRAPYRHFATKEELLVAVAIEGFRSFETFARPRFDAAGDDVIAKLRAIAQSYVLFAVEHASAFRVMHAPYDTVKESAPALLETRARGHRVTMDLIAEGQAKGVLRAGDPMQLALVLWTSMHGLAVLLTEGQLGRYDRPIDAAKLSSLVSGLLFEGLAAPKPNRKKSPA